MEVLYDKKNLFYEILSDNECILLKKDAKEIRNKILLSPVSGVVKRMDSNNAEIIIKSFKWKVYKERYIKLCKGRGFNI